MRKKIDLIITILCVAIALLIFNRFGAEEGGVYILAAAVLGAVHLFLAVSGEKNGKYEKQSAGAAKEQQSAGMPTELVLLSEEGERIAAWNIYGKNGVVIGRDTGENHVDVNLDQTAYAGMIDVEHAVLNYSGDDWYIEDISSKNGVSVLKRDGKKYRIAYGKPCKTERGDIIYIGLTRLRLS